MIRNACRLLLCAFAVSAVAYGESATSFYGTNQAHPTFNHPQNLTTLSGAIVRYEMQPFRVNQNAECFIASVQEGNDFDGMIFLYEDGFNAALPLTNLIAFDDDDGDTFDIGTSRIEPIELFAANDYFLVTSGYGADDIGTFQNTITCDEPSTRVLVGYGQFGNNTASAYDGRTPSCSMAALRFRSRASTSRPFPSSARRHRWPRTTRRCSTSSSRPTSSF